MNTYKVLVYCNNCNYNGNIEILKGTPVPDNMKCPNCGCKSCSKQPFARPRPGKQEQPGILPY